MTILLGEKIETNSAPTKSIARVRECWFWAGWEPDRYYKRIGARSTLFFGNGDWIADWRARMESSASLQTVQAASGGAVLITRFYKGFGLNVERKDWDTLSQFIKRAHSHGHKVWGYLQGQSLFGEFLFNERPDAIEWIAQAYDGTKRHWGGAYNRFAPCLTSEAYLKMLESIIQAGLGELKLDGFHMDNNYYGHCYCPRCKHLFRKWLMARGDLELLTGIEKPDFIEPPPISQDAEIIPDPLMILWIEFGVEQRLKFMKAIRRKINQINPNATLTGNPAFMRNYASRLTHGYDPSLEHFAFDSVCIEDGNRPRFSEGTLYTQADKHLMAEAGSLRTWVTSWAAQKKPGGNGYQAPLNPQSIWAGLAEEFSFRNALMGNNWALRPTGDAEVLLKDSLSDQWQEFSKAVRYFQKLENRLGDMDRRQWGEIVVYVDTRSLSLSPGSDCLVLKAFLGCLFRERISFKIVFQNQALPPETRLILLVGQRGVKTSELERLAAFVATPGRELFLLGECGVYDEWFVPRGAGNRARLLDRPNVCSFPLHLHQWIERKGAGKKYFQGQPSIFTREGRLEIDPVIREIGKRQRIEVIAPEGILTNIERMSDARLLLHIRDLREDHTFVRAQDVKIILREKPEETDFFSEKWTSDSVVSSREADGRMEVLLPEFCHYACLAFTFAGNDDFATSA